MFVHMQLVYVDIHFYVGMKRNSRRMLNIIIFRVDINISQFNIISIHAYIHKLQILRLHVNIMMLHVDIIYIACRGRIKYATMHTRVRLRYNIIFISAMFSGYQNRL